MADRPLGSGRRPRELHATLLEGLQGLSKRMDLAPRPRHEYDPSKLASWSTVVHISGTALGDWSLWGMVWRYVGLSLVTGIVLTLFMPGMHFVDSELFLRTVNVIKVFLPFVLGLYLKACLSRWWSTMVLFSDFFVSIKKVLLVLNSLGGNPDEVAVRAATRRYALASCHLLHLEVRTLWWEAAEREAALSETLARCAEHGFLRADEEDALRATVGISRADALWMWIGQVVAGLQHTPPMAARVQALCCAALEASQRVKTGVTMQYPLPYAHMVALLLHTNNVLVALANGVSLASFCSNVLVQLRAMRRRDPLLPGQDPREQLYEALQGLGMALVAVMLEPLVYQAFWVVCANFNDPFGSSTHCVDVASYTSSLQESLAVMETFATHKLLVKPPKIDDAPEEEAPEEEEDTVWRPYLAPDAPDEGDE